MNRNAPVRLGAACAAVLAAIAMSVAAASPVAGQFQPTSSGGGATVILSPVAVASWFTERTGNQAEQLQLLVLWRGRPAWFFQPGGSSEHGHSEAGRVMETIIQGGIRLTLEYDRAARVVTIQGNRIELGSRNVVFVDEVDSQNGARVVGTMQIDSAMPGSAGQIGPVLRKSPEIMTFLRCDATTPDPRRQAMIEGLCMQNIGANR